MSVIGGFLFWIGYRVLPVVFIFALLFAAFVAPSMWKQWRCKHEKYREDRMCNAICRHCDKNLGFIQPVRARNPNGERP